jgi:hypothetical protein
MAEYWGMSLTVGNRLRQRRMELGMTLRDVYEATRGELENRRGLLEPVKQFLPAIRLRVGRIFHPDPCERVRTSEARAHHYVPQCWLSGFTESGKRGGRLFVTDLTRSKQWPTTPPNAGYERDFNRVEDSNRDPLAFETFFSRIESDIANHHLFGVISS